MKTKFLDETPEFRSAYDQGRRDIAIEVINKLDAFGDSSENLNAILKLLDIELDDKER